MKCSYVSCSKLLALPVCHSLKDPEKLVLLGNRQHHYYILDALFPYAFLQRFTALSVCSCGRQHLLRLATVRGLARSETQRSTLQGIMTGYTQTHTSAFVCTATLFCVPTITLFPPFSSVVLSEVSWLPRWLLNPYYARCRLSFLTSSLTWHAHLLLLLYDTLEFSTSTLR